MDSNDIILLKSPLSVSVQMTPRNENSLIQTFLCFTGAINAPLCSEVTEMGGREGHVLVLWHSGPRAVPTLSTSSTCSETPSTKDGFSGASLKNTFTIFV